MTTNSFHRHALLSLVLICCFSLQAQTDWPKHLDSLEKVLSTQKVPPEMHLKIYDDLSWEYPAFNIKKGIFYAKKGIDLAKKNGNDLMECKLYRNLGIAYSIIPEHDTAVFYFEKALHIASLLNNERMEISVYGAMANMYNRQGVYPKALEYYMKVLSYTEKLKDSIVIGRVLCNIGTIYNVIPNYEKALFYFLQSEEIARKQKDTAGLATVFQNLSGLYRHMKEYDKAIEYLQESDKIFLLQGNLYGQAISTQGYTRIYITSKDFTKALEYANKGVALAEKLGSKNLIAWNMGHLSSVYYEQSNYEQCKSTCLQALVIDSTDISLNNLLYGNLILASSQIDSKDTVRFYLSCYTTALQYFSNEALQHSLSEMEVKYETEKKELKIAAMEDERRFITWLSITGGALLLLALAFFIVRQRLAVSRRKMAEQQVKQLEQEKQLVATQAVLDGETAERTRLARDLHDGLGGMLSVVKLKLNDVKKGASLEGEDVQRFDQALHTLEESIGELRRVAHNMMPDSLTRYGLKPSLSDFCNSIPGAEFHYFGDGERLDPKLEVMIYRTVHELVNNALKHAEAEHIIVQMVQEPDRMAITVQDDGRGFDTATPTAGTGLNNIRHRVGSYNGRMDLSSTPGKGTEVMIEFILKP